jgi:hypothetical protein
VVPLLLVHHLLDVTDDLVQVAVLWNGIVFLLVILI